MNKDRQAELRRLDRIFDVIQYNPNATREQIQTRLSKRYEEVAKERALESEQRARQAIGSLFIVQEIKHSKPYSITDKLGIDDTVIFEGNGYVFMQVKSSAQRIEQFVFERRLTQFRLMQGRMVLVNGQQSQDHILDDFVSQVLTIHEFNLQRYGNPILARTDKDYLFLRKALK